MISGNLARPAPTLGAPRSPRWWSALGAAASAQRPGLIFGGTMLAALLAHAVNMLNFPYYENDEGIYMAQAWSVLTNQGLAPYTYWYDHPPVGWMQIAAWMALTGGPLTFGTAVASGRILMLLFHLGSAILLYRVGQRITGSAATGAVAVLLFSLSPLGIYFQRRVLLDNMMTFWILAAIYLLLCRYRGGLGPVVLSGVAFAIALLSKEIGVVFLPALLALLWTRLDRRHRPLGLLTWLTIVFAIGSAWIVYALLKGELFPSGSALGGAGDHTSLLGTLAYQASRGNGEGIFSFDNDFWKTMRLYWLPRDPFIIIAGLAATAITTLLSLRRRAYWHAALPALCILAFLARGALVIEYYIIPAIPFFALTIAVVGTWLVETYRAMVARRLWPTLTVPARLAEGALALSVVAGAGNALQGSQVMHDLYRADQVRPQVQALEWAKSNIPKDAFIIADHYGLLELWLAGFERAHSHWKIDRDTMITDRLLNKDWRNVDYLLVTPQVANDMQVANLEIVSAAYSHSSLSQMFEGEAGWTVEARKVDNLAVTAVRVADRALQPDGSRTFVVEVEMTATKHDIDHANLLFEVRSPTGEIIAKAVTENVIFDHEQETRFSAPLTLPPGADLASATVIVGSFPHDWQGTYMWREFHGLLTP
jgi:4-amino-4-deoxy-L-arabinose transferase-like glycosyltransferase